MPEKAKVAILISGRGSNMAALLYAAKSDDCPYEIVLVTGDRPDAAGFDVAEAEGVRVERLDGKALGKAFWETLQSTLEASGADTIALAGFMRIVPSDFVARWQGKMLNIHPSLLPKYKGLHTHQTAIDNGDTVTGATVHLVVPEVDSGTILGQVEVAILPGDDEASLAERVLIAEHQLYPRVLGDYLGRALDPEWITEEVGIRALALPETMFKTSHGAPAWRVGSKSSGKFFAIMWLRHHGEESVGLLVKCSGQEEMAQLIEADPDLYFRPQYYGPSNWIGMRLDRPGTDWDHVSEWLERSWAECAPPRVAKLHRAAAEF